MALLTATNLSHHYGELLCFREATFALHEGARVGLIGANGTGKTTLLRVLLGELEYEGELALKRNLRLAFLEQDPSFPAGQTVWECLLAASGEIHRLEEQLAAVQTRLGQPGLPAEESAELLERLSELEHQFSAARGYELEPRARQILQGLGFSRERYAQTAETLSGGERNRLALARLLLLEPDVWLLDEPTNHLDLDGLLFLEHTLKESAASAIIVSHDRHFLDEVTTETWELEGARLFQYPGSYTQAKRLRAERHKAQQRAFEKQQEFITREQGFIRRYKAGQRAKEARGRLKRLDRLERLEGPAARQTVMKLHLPVFEPPGQRALEVRGLSIGYGDRPLLSKLDFELTPGETLGLVGPNGTGKTTLLRVLLGQLPALLGEFEWGQKARTGVLWQHEEFPDGDYTPVSYIRSRLPDLTYQEVRDTLGAMLFSGDGVDKAVSVLSGGERKRLMLTRLLLEGNNCLVLDEPTNHLDIPSREALELALTAYEGTLLVVSHDRYFLDQVADRILWIEDGGWKVTCGGFREALEARELGRAPAPEPAPRATRRKVPAADGAKPAKKPRPFAKYKTEELEERIGRLETQIKELQWQFNAPELYANHQKLRQVQETLKAAQAELAGLEEEYFSRER